jgi:hypothetical protein
VSVTERSQPKGVKPKMRERKLRSGVYWQGELKQKGANNALGEYVQLCLPYGL